MHEIDIIFIFHFYINAFEFATELIITQFQLFISINIFIQIRHISKILKNVKMPLLYNFFIFNSIQKKYPIYKRELYVIIIFYKKYNYLCKHSY